MKRSLFGKFAAAAVASIALAGCLVSEEPVLDEKNGAARPLEPGDYKMCPVSNEAEGSECVSLTLSADDSGLYTLANADEPDDPAHMRMRRIARGGYAVQINEDDGYMYYYGRAGEERFTLTMMMCDSLPAKTRERLITRGDLAADEENEQICVVKNLKALAAAAQDYHKGRATDAEDVIALDIIPVKNP